MAETNYTPAVLRTIPLVDQARYILAAHAALVCSIAGCKFRGIQESLVPQADISTALILFDDSFSSTLCLEAQFFTLDAVREKLEASADKWFKAAATRQAAVTAQHGAAAPARDTIATLRLALGVEPDDERDRR